MNSQDFIGANPVPARTTIPLEYKIAGDRITTGARDCVPRVLGFNLSSEIDSDRSDSRTRITYRISNMGSVRVSWILDVEPATNGAIISVYGPDQRAKNVVQWAKAWATNPGQCE